MRGIAGALVLKRKFIEFSDKYLCRLRDSVSHRGPDGAGVWSADDRRARPSSFAPTRILSRYVKMLTREDMHDLHYHDDLVYYDGVYYGDWIVLTEDMITKTHRGRIQKYSQVKAQK